MLAYLKEDLELGEEDIKGVVKKFPEVVNLDVEKRLKANVAHMQKVLPAPSFACRCCKAEMSFLVCSDVKAAFEGEKRKLDASVSLPGILHEASTVQECRQAPARCAGLHRCSFRSPPSLLEEHLIPLGRAFDRLPAQSYSNGKRFRA